MALPLGNPLTQGAESFFFWVWVSWRLWPDSHARGLRHHIRTDGSPEVRLCACQMAWPAEALEMTALVARISMRSVRFILKVEIC